MSELLSALTKEIIYGSDPNVRIVKAGEMLCIAMQIEYLKLSRNEQPFSGD